MRRKTYLLIGCMLAAALYPASSLLRAELSGQIYNGNIYVLLLGITEEPDPITANLWDPVLDGTDPLNPEGGDRGDGPADLAFDPVDANPAVAWSFNAVTDYDIAFTKWDGEGWEEEQFVTSTITNDLDPRVAFGVDGRIYVIWWESPSEQVWVSHRPADDPVWQTPELIVTNGRRPSIVMDGPTRLVAFERDGADGLQEIVIHTTRLGGMVDENVLVVTDYDLPLNVRLHRLNGRIWIDWQHSSIEFGFSEYIDGNWSVQPGTMPWVDRSWLGIEDVRRSIQIQLLTPQP